MKEGSTGNAIRSTNSLESRGVVGSGIATNYVISEAAGVIQIEDAELRVVEDVKGLGAKLHTDAFCHFEMLQQRQIGVEAAWIVEKVPAGISESKSSRSDKLRRISQQRTETLRIASWRERSTHYIRIRGGDAETAGYSSIVGEGNPSVAGTINDRKWRA